MAEREFRMEGSLPEDERTADARLVEAIHQDAAVFVTLYDRYGAAIYRYLYSHVSSPRDAEDLTSQVFLSAFQHFSRFQPRADGGLAAWLFTIARNKLRDFYRARRVEVPLDLAEPTDAMEAPEPAVALAAATLDTAALGAASDLLNDVIRAETLRRLRGLLRQLPGEEQELLRLRFVADLTFGQIAALTHHKEAAVKKQIYRLLARLERQMEDGDE